MTKEQATNKKPGDYVYLIYASRFRTTKDRQAVFTCFRDIFGYAAYTQDHSTDIRFSDTHLQVGQSFLAYPQSAGNSSNIAKSSANLGNKYSFTNSNLKHLEAVIKCLEMNWMTILVGHSCVGKTTLIRMLSTLINQPVVEFSVNSATDTSDLLGGFAKSDHLKTDMDLISKQI